MDFLESYLQSFDLESLAELSSESLLNYARSELEYMLSLNQEDVKVKRCAYFKIPGTLASDYSERIFALDGNKKVLIGIRHAGADPTKPFISLHLNYSISRSEEIREAYQKVKLFFNKFDPSHISIWCNPKSSLYTDLLEKATPRLNHLAANTSSLIHANKSISLPDNIGLKKVENADYYDWYQVHYTAFHKENPGLKNWVTCNDIEDMNQAMKAGLLWRICKNNQVIGLIQGEYNEYLGQNALYLAEILLIDAFRGQGIAPKAQIEYIRKLAQDKTLIWGTIDCSNLPSLKTAQKVGRKKIRSEFFLPIQ